MSSETVVAETDGRCCSEYSTTVKFIKTASHVLTCTGSPFGLLNDFTTCLTCSMYLFTVRGLRDRLILSMSDLTDRLSMLASGRSPIVGRIHLSSPPCIV